nr:MAG TPA: hypothetical protein [Caudoviricetes sp.]
MILPPLLYDFGLTPTYESIYLYASNEHLFSPP